MTLKHQERGAEDLTVALKVREIAEILESLESLSRAWNDFVKRNTDQDLPVLRDLTEAYTDFNEARLQLEELLSEIKSIPEVDSGQEIEILECLGRRPPRQPMRQAREVQCPVCGNATMEYREDLELDFSTVGQRVILANLTGHVCSHCGERMFDAKSSRLIDRYLGDKPRGGYHISVSSLGGGKLGIYLPEDVLRQLDFQHRNTLLLIPITKTKLMVEKVENPSAES